LTRSPKTSILRREVARLVGAYGRNYLIFGDIEGKLEVLRVECTKCDRKGRYSVASLIAKHGRKGLLSDWYLATTAVEPNVLVTN
jgi:hypothetical protein